MQYEIITYNENLPFRIHIMDTVNREYHLHKEMELVFVLKGSVTYEVRNKKFKLFEKDLFLVNSLDMHMVRSDAEENILLILHLDPTFFNQYCSEFSSYYYHPMGALRDNSPSIYEKITSDLAMIMLALVKSSKEYKLDAMRSVIDIALTLFQSCRMELRKQQDGDQLKQQRISGLLTYIDENYSSKIGLDTLSKELKISSGYISAFFKHNLGIGFVDYINKLRITKSLNDLLGSRKSILEIALDHGFNDHKAYNRVFKKEMGMTPTEYRGTVMALTPVEQSPNHPYFRDPTSDIFKTLFEHLKTHGENHPHHSTMITEKITVEADLTKSKGQALPQFWREIVCVERASLCLRSEVQHQIRIAQKDIGYTFVKFHGIFSEEMMVYREDDAGNPIYNWHYVDEIIDFFYSVGLKPFIEIGFMPEALASKKQYAPYFWRPNVSFPKSIKKWSRLVYDFAVHCMERYGEAEVKEWLFEVWDAPELTNIFWYESKELFWELYKESYYALKKASSKLKVGSPGILPFHDFQWLGEFLHYCTQHEIIIDFAACNIFSLADPQNKTIPSEIMKNEKIQLSTSDENYLQASLESMRNKLQAAGLGHIAIYVAEWNLSPYTVDYTRDTCFLSTYIVSNVLRNIGRVNGLGYWSLSDIMDQGITASSIFHGGYGLFTRNTLKKPACNAFYLLNKLGSHVMDRGSHYVITKKDPSSYQILLYNYVYFDELFRSGDRTLLSYKDRYNIYQSASVMDIQLTLQLNEGRYRLKRYRLDRESGSTFDAWLKMGAPEQISSDIYDYLKSKEMLDIRVTEEVCHGRLTIHDLIPVHGVLLIEVDQL